ncbi:uncharacterized protein APUU_70834S [Aspergillus puulaauensis]|uniref:Signal peptidase complex catalytic subunit SEC11 n=1 Tax=Aspergillus puulaauensis TaxID=1220207 RepID=A0A7R7XZ26_9EURO|nr:uncharacterized protein APUU_70834S [Aspergillus puulaauensis]BCS29264.1 hypothetical protein APUU_70834S [Aspergillus puulaauensis]
MQSTLNAILGAAQLVASCFMAWKAISLCTGTPYPMMVVTTGSMLPAFAPGDVLFVSNHYRDAAIGDLPVCWLPGSAIPMVHRVHRVTYVHNQNNLSQQLILTKGDNNPIDDTVMYPGSQGFLDRGQVLGFVRGYVPFIGWVVIAVQELSRLPELATMLFRGIGS